MWSSDRNRQVDHLLMEIQGLCDEGVKLGKRGAVVQLLAENLLSLVEDDVRDQCDEIMRNTAVLPLAKVLVDALTQPVIIGPTIDVLEQARYELGW